MSKIATLFVIFACLTTAFALNASLTKSYFFVNTYNQLSYKLFHTANGIIAYNSDYVEKIGKVPQYLLLNPLEGSVTLILEDLLSFCDLNRSTNFDRLHYHIQTSTLAYFCTANNSLLILDQKTYAVQASISTGISTNFSEAKLTADGNSLYVLLMGSLYTKNQTASQLVQFDLSTRGVIGDVVVFNTGLETDEYVNGFVIQNSEAFALTNTINSPTGHITISIYYLALSGSDYGLYKLTNFTNGNSPHFLSQLYLVGDHLVTNNLSTLIILSKGGKTVLTEHHPLQFKFPYSQTVYYIPAIVAQDGSSDLYVLFINSTLAKFTSENGTIVSEEIGTAYDFQIAYGNHYTNDLLFTVDSLETTYPNFNIINLQNSDLVYSVPSLYNDFVLSASTFGILRDSLLQVFNRLTNELIGNISLSTPLLIQKDTDTLYYSALEGSTSCVIKQLNLTTLSTVDIQRYSDYLLCYDVIEQFKISGNGHPEFVALHLYNDAFSIATEGRGIVDFNLSDARSTFNIMPVDDLAYIVPDFQTLSLYLLQSDGNDNSQISNFEFNGTGFYLIDSYNFTGYVGEFYAYGTETAFAISNGYFSIIDLVSCSKTDYYLSTFVSQVSSILDNDGNACFIFSDSRTGGDWSGNVTQPSTFDFVSNEVGQLPGTTNFTVQAGAAGPRSYWIVDGFISGVGLVKFYETSAQDTQEDTSMFSILQ